MQMQRPLNVQQDNDLPEMAVRVQHHVPAERSSNALGTRQPNNVILLLQLNRGIVPRPLSSNAIIPHIRAEHDLHLLIVREEQVNRRQHNDRDIPPNVQVERAQQERSKYSAQEYVLAIRRHQDTAHKDRGALAEEHARQVARRLRHRKRMNVVRQSSKRNQPVPFLFHHRSW